MNVKLAIGETATFPVDARNLWNPSQVDLEKGGQYSIEVTEITEKWKDAYIASSLSKGWNPPARWIAGLFQPKARAPHLPMYAFVGAIDEDSRTFFLIGEGARLLAPQAGQLQAFANDWPGHYDNNHGRLQVLVRRLDPQAPATP